MARLFGNVIGNLSGKLGNLSARITNGKTILAARPASFNAPSDAAAIARRNTFLATVKFALEVVTLPALKKLWEEKKPSGVSVFNQVVSANYQYATPDRPTNENIITPGGFALNVAVAALDTDKFTATIPALNQATVLSPEEVHCVMNAVICYHTPLTPGDAPYNIIHLSSTVPNYNFGQEYNLQLNLNVLQKAIAEKYDSSIVYFAVVTKTADERIKQSSGTVVKAF